MTEGQAADSPQFVPVLRKVRVRGPIGRPRTRPDAVAGDKAYSSRGNRAYLRKRRHQGRHPGEDRPGRQPQEEGRQGWSASRPRRRALQGPEHRRAPDQQAEGLAGHRDSI
ncbi:hypothetical protein ACIRYZ_42680 [Kitasatospora sp. NPDC101155]|uniref:hypothetical protein n=1 Tax=Kitasatospora sp. NPDC101155 TaxID=3364097 RepID=UPI00381443EC